MQYIYCIVKFILYLYEAKTYNQVDLLFNNIKLIAFYSIPYFLIN